jgi:serine/threonine-protein phosphatase 2A regulatory subunit A
MGPFDLYKTQMDDGNTEAKVDGMKRLPVVAYAMGSAKTQSELLPYLQTTALKQPPIEDELLLLMAKQLETFVPALLSTPKQILELLPIVESLGTVEETVVRDQAVTLMNHLCTHLKPNAPLDAPLVSSLVSMAKRLGGADWFTAKVSCAGMLPELYALTQHADISSLYKELCVDETPMVRRAASQHIGKLMKHLGTKEKASELIPVLQQLSKDEQDSVRMLAVASMSHVGDTYSSDPEWTKEFLLPLVKDASTDMSW